MKTMELTILVEKDESGLYVGQLQEYPEAISQGATLEELKENLKDALRLLLDYKKEELSKGQGKRKIFIRRLLFAQ